MSRCLYLKMKIKSALLIIADKHRWQCKHPLINTTIHYPDAPPHRALLMAKVSPWRHSPPADATKYIPTLGLKLLMFFPSVFSKAEMFTSQRGSWHARRTHFHTPEHKLLEENK